MSEVTKKRRRRKTKATVEESPSIAAEVLEVEESKVEHTLRVHEETKAAQKSITVVGKYYYVQPFITKAGKEDGKVILVREKSTGTLYRSYMGRKSKMKAFLEDVKEKGLLRTKG